MYIDLIHYESEMLLDKMAGVMLKLRGRPKILCDSAEPRTIEELRKRHVNARAAKKGPDSVRQRIMFIKQHKLYVTSRSVELIDEWQRYCWSDDKDGRITDKPIDRYKHCSDAASYAISTAMRQKVTLLQ